MEQIKTDNKNKGAIGDTALTEKVIGCAFDVSNVLGHGFSEKVYENALKIRLVKSGMEVRQQVPITVWSDAEPVGNFVADLIVNHQLLLELKAVDSLRSEHMAQCLNHLKATGIAMGLLINFGQPRVEVRRIQLQSSSESSVASDLSVEMHSS